jgi:hypothetical protein
VQRIPASIEEINENEALSPLPTPLGIKIINHLQNWLLDSTWPKRTPGCAAFHQAEFFHIPLIYTESPGIISYIIYP